MKIVNVAIALGILVLAAISSTAIIGLADSDSDGVVEDQFSGMIAQIQNTVSAVDLADLKVQAEGNAANAYPGETGNANILVLVTNKGAPVDDLTEDNFKMRTILVPPGGGAVKVTDFYNYGKGAYTFGVLPIEGVTWGVGEYDIQVRVTRGGQAIASIELGY
ncbi:MAG TPA: hypothetical protein EYP28_03340 [Methanophagales archaeon]|nr:hypothetical protein [Methanophagales archaeon]